ncbi:MAG: carotenoid oxygenase family protein [Acidimicrobiia bacterium]
MADQAELTFVDASTNPFLHGMHAPVTDELDVGSLAVSGRIPPELHGSYLRNGPNPQFAPIGSYAYPFDGDGMIHEVSFAERRASYRNRWVVTDGLAAERAMGHALWGGVFTPNASNDKRCANNTVVRHGGRLLALDGFGLPYRLNDELFTIEPYDADGKLPSVMGAHTKLDPATGELHWIACSRTAPEVVYGVLSSGGDVTFSTKIGVPAPALVHDFAITETSIVLLVPPVVFASDGTVRWQPALGTRVGVLPRGADGLRTHWTKTTPFYVSHIANAWSEHGATYIDFIRYAGFSELGEPEGTPNLHRLRVDPVGKVAQASLVDFPCEMPVIDGRMLGRRHRFTYCAAQTGDSSDGANALLRYDTDSRAIATCDFGADSWVGEPLLVPRPGWTAEDDAWLLAYVQAPDRDGTDLVIIDAGAFADGPVAKVHLPQRVPPGSHGTWLPAR